MKVNIKEIIRFIDEQVELGKKVAVDRVAKHFNITRRWVSSIFQMELHCTPHEYIHQRENMYWQKCLTLKCQEPLKKVIPELGISRSTYYRRIYKFNKEHMVINSPTPSNAC